MASSEYQVRLLLFPKTNRRYNFSGLQLRQDRDNDIAMSATLKSQTDIGLKEQERCIPFLKNTNTAHTSIIIIHTVVRPRTRGQNRDRPFRVGGTDTPRCRLIPAKTATPESRLLANPSQPASTPATTADAEHPFYPRVRSSFPVPGS